MKKTMLEYYKPNRDMTKGAALQVTRTNSGVNLQLSKQATPLDMKSGRNATFDWQYNSFSATLKVDELSKIVSYAQRAMTELEATISTNKIAQITGIDKKAIIDTEVLKDCRFPHLNSTTPKTISVQINEYPANSGELTMRISIRGTMGYKDQTSGQFVKKENESIQINLKDYEFKKLLLVFEAEISNQLEDNLINCTIVNESMQDPKGINGCKTIKEIRLPSMNPGETIVGLRKNLTLIIKRKGYDAGEQKMVYFCEELQ